MDELVKVTMENGSVVLIAPLSLTVWRGIVENAATLHPFPERAQYEEVVENAVIPGDVIPAENNPRYIDALKEVENARRLFTQDAAIECSVYDVEGGRDSSFAKYSSQLPKLRKYAKLPEDDFLAIVLSFYARTQRDLATIINVASKRLPLTQEEVIDGVRYFRVDVQRNPSRNNPEKQEPSGVQSSAAQGNEISAAG